jgi:hypothetical protein
MRAEHIWAGTYVYTAAIVHEPESLEQLQDLVRRSTRIRALGTRHSFSPCYHKDCVAIHFTWKQDWPAIQPVLFEIEIALEPLSARPHWGKFRNAFIDSYIFGQA